MIIKYRYIKSPAAAAGRTAEEEAAAEECYAIAAGRKHLARITRGRGAKTMAVEA